MLDSLVRVSRRVGWSTDRFATDPAPARLTERTPPPRGYRALQAVATEVERTRGARDQGWLRHPRLRDVSTTVGYNSPDKASRASSHLPTGLLTAARAGRGSPPGESAPSDRRATPGGVTRYPLECQTRHRDRRAEFPGPNCCGSTRLPLCGFTYC